MATALISTGIQFPDSTIQTTAGLTSVIKSIQRGVSDGGSTNITITISTVNPGKCMVILDHEGGSVDTSYYTPYLIGISSTSFVTSPSYVSGPYFIRFSWQVIEFY